MERRRLNRPQPVLETMCTGTLTWMWLSPDVPAYTMFNVLMCSRPRPGPAYVIRFVGHKVYDRMLYLFRTVHDDQSKYMACRRESPEGVIALCKIAEDHANGGEVVPSDHRTLRDDRPPPVRTRGGGRNRDQGNLF